MEVLKKEVAASTVKEKFLQHLEMVDFTFDAERSKVIREEALEALKTLEFPTSKTEYWKYTRLSSLLNKNYSIKASEASIDIAGYSYENSHRLVFVNGFFRPDLSDQKSLAGVTVCSMAEAKEHYSQKLNPFLAEQTKASSDIFTVLNNAFHNDGAFVCIAKNKKIETPIHIIHLIDGEEILAQPRNLIIAETGSEAKLIESFETAVGKDGLINNLTELVLEENARLEYNKVQDLKEQNHQICTEYVQQEANSHFTINTISLSGKMIRNNLNIAVEGKGCMSHLNGLISSEGQTTCRQSYGA